MDRPDDLHLQKTSFALAIAHKWLTLDLWEQGKVKKQMPIQYAKQQSIILSFRKDFLLFLLLLLIW